MCGRGYGPGAACSGLEVNLQLLSGACVGWLVACGCWVGAVLNHRRQMIHLGYSHREAVHEVTTARTRSQLTGALACLCRAPHRGKRDGVYVKSVPRKISANVLVSVSDSKPTPSQPSVLRTYGHGWSRWVNLKPRVGHRLCPASSLTEAVTGILK